MNIQQDGISPNAGRLLWAGFTAILAAGVGFGIRGGILAAWGSEFGFTAQMLGVIGGAHTEFDLKGRPASANRFQHAVSPP